MAVLSLDFYDLTGTQLELIAKSLFELNEGVLADWEKVDKKTWRGKAAKFQDFMQKNYQINLEITSTDRVPCLSCQDG